MLRQANLITYRLHGLQNSVTLTCVSFHGSEKDRLLPVTPASAQAHLICTAAEIPLFDCPQLDDEVAVADYKRAKRRLLVLGYNATLTTAVEAPRQPNLHFDQIQARTTCCSSHFPPFHPIFAALLPEACTAHASAADSLALFHDMHLHRKPTSDFGGLA